jgi:hypothetical protein
MTCIVAIAQDGRVYMGGDAAGSDPHSGMVITTSIPKVFVKDEYVLGYSGSFRMGKWIQYSADFPKPPSWAKGEAKIDEFINGFVVPSLRKQAKEAELEPQEKEDFGFLVGLRGYLFELDESWAAYPTSSGYAASGSGAEIALGSIYSTSSWKNPVKRVTVALEASHVHNAYVRPPFTIVEN